MSTTFWLNERTVFINFLGGQPQLTAKILETDEVGVYFISGNKECFAPWSAIELVTQTPDRS